MKEKKAQLAQLNCYIVTYIVTGQLCTRAAVNGSRRCGFYPTLCQGLFDWVFKAMASWIRGKLKQTIGNH